MASLESHGRGKMTRDVSYFADGEAAWMSSEDAHKALDHVIAAVARSAGFDGIESEALAHMRSQVEMTMQGLLYHAAELATVGRRRKPSMRDIFIALVYAGPRMHPAELQSYLASTSKETLDDRPEVREWASQKCAVKRKHAGLPEWARLCDDWLASDDEDDGVDENDATSKETEGKKEKDHHVVTWSQKRRKQASSKRAEIPAHLPALPPAHTWRTTPAFPVKATSSKDPISFIETKVSSTRLTEASLRSLIRATDKAAFDGQIRRMRKAVPDRGDESTIEEEGEGSNSAKDSPLAAAVTTATLPQEDSERLQRKSRGRSLRVRTSIGNASGADVSADTSKANGGPQTATPRSSTTFILPSRRGSLHSAGAALGGSAEKAGATPLTPGAGFAFPSAPLHLQAQGFAGSTMAGAEEPDASTSVYLEGAEAAPSAEISIPGPVNYKSKWYKKSTTSSKS